ncbi:oxygen tolerance protein BatD [Mariniflexile fucanivorans]|uniref:Oxygen tolerance protein BatD n=1 Tax=Mariniflexile fucanivorans TaxID=264023 RepID=A0A4R1RCK9_9FLAO|nr:BatD family protein [Mariniflexile fucanivorans]TCL63574.1 oxygen tolerance protein BatD [Mariniflexile fucanivorans]
MKFIKHISIILIILTTSMLSAQVKFDAKVSKQKLGVNERLRIDFEMNQDGDNFNPTDFSNFTVVGGPNQSVSNSWINGVRSFKKTYSYFLAPKGRGNFTIAQATINIGGETYKTVPIPIEVTAAVEIPKDPNNPEYIASENIHLVAEISKTNPYLNEAITVVYKLYVSPNIAVDSWNEIDSPRYNDFWSQNIDTQDQKVQNGMFKGEEYRFLVLRKKVLYPQKTGKLDIEPLSLDIALRVPTNRRDIFGSLMMTRTNRVVSAGNSTINVKALPEEGKPLDFSGAVGDFSFDVVPSKTSLDASESLQLKVAVKGNGNLKLFKLPKVSLPSSLEVYEPEHKEEVNTSLSGMQGAISDSYTIVPQFKGKYPIPSISFSYFDLKTEKYKRLSSDEIILDVLDGPINNANTNNATVTNNGKQAVVLNKDQFAFIKTKTTFESIHNTTFFKTTGFWSLLLLPFLAIPLAIVIRNKKATRDADVYGNRIRKADKLAKKYLSHAKKSLGQKEAFYIALEKALHNYLKAKLHIETYDLSKEKINELLAAKQVENEVIVDFNKILESCELARYTPIDIVTMREDYEKAAKTISLIDKQAR